MDEIDDSVEPLVEHGTSAMQTAATTSAHIFAARHPTIN
jgi:hypothetical protein